MILGGSRRIGAVKRLACENSISQCLDIPLVYLACLVVCLVGNLAHTVRDVS